MFEDWYKKVLRKSDKDTKESIIKDFMSDIM